MSSTHLSESRTVPVAPDITGIFTLLVASAAGRWDTCGGGGGGGSAV